MARKFWRQHAPALERRGCLTMLDEMSFSSLCEAWAMVRLCEELVQRDGLTITGPRGKVSLHPLVRERARWEKLLLTMMRDFGLTPSSRKRLGITEPAGAEEDPFLLLLDGKKGDGDK